MAQAIRAILLASAMAATLVDRRASSREPGTMLGAMDLGIANDDQRAGHEQAAQIAVTNWSDPEQRTGTQSFQGRNLQATPSPRNA